MSTRSTRKRIVFYPDEKEINIEPETDILEAAIGSGVHINSPCGGKGVCGKCKIKIKQGQVETKTGGLLTRDEIDAGFVLACATTVLTDVEVNIPPSSRLTDEQILTEEVKIEHLERVVSRIESVECEGGVCFTIAPLAKKFFLKLPQPTIDDHTADLERIYREINKITGSGNVSASLSTIRLVPGVLRDGSWQITALMGRGQVGADLCVCPLCGSRQPAVYSRLLSIEPGDTSLRNFGLAIDVGTTTVVAQLVDLNSGRVIDTEASYNRQTHYGADVITRIIFSRKKQGMDRLYEAIVNTINDLIYALIEEHKILQDEICSVVCAGNTTMLHLLLKIDPAHIRLEPYIPVANFTPLMTASEMGIKINPSGLVACLPHVASYVGADITSGVLASGICDSDEPAMLIDIGTNGEIVIGNKDWLVCCASSAGPAFEGGGIRAGIRAMAGAIQRVEISPVDYMVQYDTIGQIKPIGICGSGLIDTLTEMLKAGIIDRAGNIRTDISTERIRETEDGLEFVLVFRKDSGTDEDIVINQSDISNLIFSKGAIYTACVVLAKRIGFEINNLERVYIAGGFGNYLNIEKSIMIGLLPDISRGRYKFIGNSSLVGARHCLLSDEAMKMANEIAGKMTYIELSADTSYMHEYTASLFLPHTDMSRFPGVPLMSPAISKPLQ